jgi:hypothetical protein
MSKKVFIVCVSALAFLVGANLAFALDPIPKQPGFSGFIQPGAGYLNIKSNLVAKVVGFELSDKKADDLDNEPESKSTLLVTIPYKIGYTFEGARTEIFLGTEPGDLLSFDTAQQLGVKQDIGWFGLLQAGLLFSGSTRVWKDPYVEDRHRDDTGRKNLGAQVTWDKMFGSNFELEYSLRKIDIGSEKSGEFLGLSNSEQDRLDRNGAVHRASLGYAFRFGNHKLVPQIALFYEDLDGEAMANSGGDFQLTWILDKDPLSFAFNGYIGMAEYDKSNPVFGKTRDDERYGASATVYYRNPWGWTLFGSEPMQFFVTGAYFAVDSNIDFYNQEAILGMGGIAFRWK